MRLELIAGLRRFLERLRHAFGHRRALRVEGALPGPGIFLGPF